MCVLFAKHPKYPKQSALVHCTTSFRLSKHALTRLTLGGLWLIHRLGNPFLMYKSNGSIDEAYFQELNLSPKLPHPTKTHHHLPQITTHHSKESFSSLDLHSQPKMDSTSSKRHRDDSISADSPNPSKKYKQTTSVGSSDSSSSTSSYDRAIDFDFPPLFRIETQQPAFRTVKYDEPVARPVSPSPPSPRSC